MKLQLVRHATLWLNYGGLQFLIDPMLGEAGAYPPITNSANDKRNPLVPLPLSVDHWLNPDAVIVTHLHNDHWDPEAVEKLPKSTPILCQLGDDSVFHSAGFEQVIPIVDQLNRLGVILTRTGGRHGEGEIGQLMGNVSGFILQADGEPTLYIAGDTIWCPEVRSAVDTYHPDMTIVNAGGARFTVGDPITMDDHDVVSLCRYAPDTNVIAVHMDAINHCLVTRSDLLRRLELEKLTHQVLIPEDGQWIE
ncbi:MBL fold metallo-hydrolase [Paenibacillus segetis]|uniref:Metallo-beta-lactamase domain-containing protein n=1 Tax=Paenibacillus segetis TaxID=1325360 RepID=A0ABQ1YS73_9BACL|nr:hypothetical protein GCM10008013_41980 [Paenibacillus segetis]